MSTYSIPSAGGRLRGARGTRFLAAACIAVVLFATGDARASSFLNIGNIYTFSTGSTAGNPAGSWTLQDKTFTYLSQSGFTMTGPGGIENMQLVDSNGTHTLSLGSLGFLTNSSTSTLGYRVQLAPSSPYLGISDVALDSTHDVNNSYVYKDVFSSLALFNAGAAAPGSGDLANLQSFNGAPSGDFLLPGVYPQVWVRDWMILDATGKVSSVNNAFTQTAVPEIEIASFAAALPLLVAGLALLERRRGARAEPAAPAAG